MAKRDIIDLRRVNQVAPGVAGMYGNSSNHPGATSPPIHTNYHQGGVGFHPECGTGYTGEATYNYNRNIRRVDIEQSKKKIIPLVRRFRENGQYGEKDWQNLLRGFCKVCKIPEFKKNLPTFILGQRERDKLTVASDRGAYQPSQEGKVLVMLDSSDIRCFLALWYAYISDRNGNFWTKTREVINGKIKSPASMYVKEIMTGSEPQQVRNLRERAYVAKVEL